MRSYIRSLSIVKYLFQIVRAVPGLKVLSAIAICKEYKTKTMNKPYFNGDASNYLIEWARKCRGWHSKDSSKSPNIQPERFQNKPYITSFA